MEVDEGLEELEEPEEDPYNDGKSFSKKPPEEEEEVAAAVDLGAE